MVSRLILVVSICFCVYTAYWMYTPLPDDVPRSWHINVAYYGLWKIVGLAGSVLDSLGVASKTDVSRYAFSKYGLYLNWISSVHDGTVNLTDMEVEGIKVRLYQPQKDESGGQQLLPGMVYYHGGGWTLGNLDTDHNLVYRFAKETPMVVMSVDYRMAPEVKFPVPFEDCLVVTKYFLKNAQKYGADPERVAIGGASAGGNLAAAVSAELRDQKFTPQVKVQVPIYPCLQVIDTDTPSYQQVPFESVMSRAGMAYFWSMYATGTPDLTSVIVEGNHTCPEIKKLMASTKLNHKTLPGHLLFSPYTGVTDLDYGDREIWQDIKDIVMNPRFSPLLDDNFRDLPTTLVWSVKYDVLRDEGFWYVQRLQEAGVKVKHVYTDNVFHGMHLLTHLIPEGDQAIKEIVKFLKEEL